MNTRSRLNNTHSFPQDYQSVMQRNPLLSQENLSDDQDHSAEGTSEKSGFCDKVLTDFVSYISEYGVPTGVVNGRILEKRRLLSSSINDNDIVMIAKPGCGFCQRAKDLLVEQQEKNPFSESIILGTDHYTKTAASDALRLSDFTFPQIIIRGTYIGGSDDLRQLVDSGEFNTLLSIDPAVHVEVNERIPWYPPLEQLASQPDLFLVPKPNARNRPRWYFFQWYMYSNLVRYISICHVVLLLLCVGMSSANNASERTKRATTAIVYILVVDLAILVVHGPTPFSPTGVIGTYLGWRYRGNVTSSLPYKVVFAAYLGSFIPLLVNRNTNGDAATASFISALINSLLLVVFRF